MQGKEYKNICLACIPVIKNAGLFIKNELNNVHHDDVETKGINSLVTYVDKTAEEKLVAGLSAILPESGFITEEGTVEQGGHSTEWIIDPLDGTNNFLHGIPHFAVSVALRVDRELVLGVVHDVMSDQTFYAWQDGGAYVNGKQIRVSQTKVLSKAIIATGFPYQIDDTRHLLTTLDYFIKKARGVRRFGAAALDLAYVACGRFDVYYETTLNAWDIAGGAVIVKEAGGGITGFKDDADFLLEGKVIASNGYLHQEILDLISTKFVNS